MEEAGEGVFQKSVRSGKWFLANVLVQRVLSLLTFLVLARFLLPEDYGVMTAVLLAVGFFNQLTTVPFGDALTQKKGNIEEYLDAVWSFDVFRALILGAALYLGSPYLADFFNLAPGDAALMKSGWILVVVPALSNARQLYFFKELDFKKIFFRDFASQFMFAAISILYVVYIGSTPWALFFGYAVQYAAGVFMSYYLYPSQPRFTLRFGSLRELLGYTKWIYGQDILDYASAQVDKIAVGRLLSPAELGIYARSKDLSSMATALATSVIGKVGFAAYSKIQDRWDKVREGFLKSVDVILIGVLPFTLLLLFEGGAVVHLLLGDSWLSLVVPLKIFSFGNLFLVFSRIVTPVFGALGRPDVNFKNNLIQLVLIVPAMVAGYVMYGFRGLALGIVAVWALMLCYVAYRAHGILEIPKRDLIPALRSGFAAVLSMLAADLAFKSVFGKVDGLPELTGRVTGLFAVYLIPLFWFSRSGRGPFATLKSIK